MARSNQGEQTIILPTYKYDKEIKIWSLDPTTTPSPLLYIPVGHNDQPTITKYMAALFSDEKIKFMMAEALT